MKRGFTLVEIIVYAALLASAAILIVNMLINLIGVFTAVRLTREVNQAASTAMERLVRASRAATSINLAASSLAADPAVIVLNDGTDMRVINNQLTVQTSGGQRQVLTGSNMVVTSFTANRVVTGTIEGVRFVLTLTDQRVGQSRTEKFYGGAILRGGYQQ